MEKSELKHGMIVMKIPHDSTGSPKSGRSSEPFILLSNNKIIREVSGLITKDPNGLIMFNPRNHFTDQNSFSFINTDEWKQFRLPTEAEKNTVLKYVVDNARFDLEQEINSLKRKKSFFKNLIEEMG